jgi:hypothetical protein
MPTPIVDTHGRELIVNSDGSLNVSPTPHASTATLTTYRNTALKDTKQTAVASAAALAYMHVYNLDSTVNYLHLYNALSASVTVGSTTPTFTLAVPASGWIDTSGGPLLWQWSVGLVVAATTTIDSSAGTPTNGLLVNFGLWS